MGEFMAELGKLTATLFSPAKMVYIAYAILLLWKTPVPLHWEFFLVSGLFLAVEIAHNDWGADSIEQQRRKEQAGVGKTRVVLWA